MDHSPGSIPSSDSSNKSTHSGFPPGTPKPPIDPPRRRSSLFFSSVTHPSRSPRTPDDQNEQPPKDHKRASKGFLQNTGRKRLHSPLTRPVVMPGHVAQMQRLFQHAKASLRLDVRFAASPTGSIDSRLPASPEEDKLDDVDPQGMTEYKAGLRATALPSKDWRYSRAPGFLTATDVDVREPFPDGSPQLPLMPLDMVQTEVDVEEPPSSGFTSPEDRVDPMTMTEQILSSSLLPESLRSEPEFIDDPPADELSADDLDHPMTKLRMVDDSEMEIDSPNDSPIVSHLRRKSAEPHIKDTESSSGSDERIVLSPSARAAANSAKLKRGLFRDLFPKPPILKGSSEVTPTSPGSKHHGHQCPDPLLHEGGPAVRCPDPSAHFVTQMPNIGSQDGLAPPSIVHPSHHGPSGTLVDRPMLLNRATATGSPMPFLKFKPPPPPPFAHTGSRQGSWYPPRGSSTHYGPPHRHNQPSNPAYLATASEHFRPGWYYARDSPRSSPRRGPAVYSFSTAAAKKVGHDPAPDSMIRDSYRTDTLTPLAKPPPRFKKNGMSAIASMRNSNKQYSGPSYLSRPPQRRIMSTRSRLPDNLQFRSSPPRSSVDSFRLQPRKRPRDLVSPTADVLEHSTAEKALIDPRLKLEEGEEVIEVDEETRAAVRMSVFGTVTPETASDAGSGLRELSPNVLLHRKGAAPSESRKKRRPSYWDGDLVEVVRSPAARHVVSSPIKKDDIRSLQADIEFDENTYEDDSPAREPNDLPGDVSKIVERHTIFHENIEMEVESVNDKN